jgi:hypothetical protein
MSPLLSTETLVVLGVIGAPFLIAALILSFNDVLLRHPIAQRLPFAPVLPVILGVLFLAAFIPLWLAGMPALQSFLASLVFPVLILLACFILITIPSWMAKLIRRLFREQDIAIALVRRQGPYRIEVPANRFVRWCIVYVAPVGPAFLPVLVLLVWLPRLLSINVSDPITARIIAISIFVPMYLWGVLSCRKLIREQDSRQ